jgi:hypothetical protein
MTNKIILEALKLKGFQNAESVARILNVVPNPTAALELLLGVYEEPNLEGDFGHEWKGRYSSDSFLIWVDSIDDIANIVTYRKYEHKMQTVYYLTKQDREDGIFVLERPKDYYSNGTQRTTGYTCSTHTISMDEFLKHYVKSPNVWEHWSNEADEYINPLLQKPTYTLEEKSVHEDLF